MPVFSSDYKIFVDTNGIPGSSSTIRLLKNHGASLVHHVQQADLVLVYPDNEDSGQKLIRDWASDPSKHVLNYLWAQRSVNEGRALMKADNWGGFLADPSMGAQDDEDFIPFSVPVERPSAPPTSAPPTTYPSGQSASGLPSYPNASNGMYPSATSHQPASYASSSTLAASNHPPPMSYEQYTPVNPQFMNQPAPQMYPESALQASMYPSYAQPQYGAQQGPMYHPSQPPYPQPPYTQPSQYPPQYAYPAAIPSNLADLSDEQRMEVINVLQSYMNHLQQQPSTSQLPPMPAPASAPPYTQTIPHQQSVPPPPVEQSPLSPPPQRRRRSPPPRASSSRSSSPALPSQDLASWASVYQGSAPTPKPKKKGLKAKVKTEGSYGSGEDNGSISTGSIMNQRAKRTKPIGSPAVPQLNGLGASSSAQGDLKIFEHSPNRSIPFFIPLTVRNRRDLVLKITRNGGKVVLDVPDADYAIFDNISGQNKDNVIFLNRCRSMNKTVLSANFIRDSADQEKFLDLDEYMFDKKTGRRRSVKPEPESSSEDEADSVDEVEQEVIPPKITKRSTGKRKTTASDSKATSSSITPDTNGASSSSAPLPKTSKKRKLSPTPQSDSTPAARSPTPPPADTAQQFNGGKYRYTDAEISWAGDHIRYLITNDPDITVLEIGRSLAEKVPHHPARSWGMYVPRVVPNLEELRKRAHIARRKKEHAATTHANALPKVRRTQTDEEHDFEFICDFFAHGGGDEGSDKEVWERIEEQRVCKTGPDWPKFYETRAGAIQAEIKRRFDERTQTTPKNEAAD